MFKSYEKTKVKEESNKIRERRIKVGLLRVVMLAMLAINKKRTITNLYRKDT